MQTSPDQGTSQFNAQIVPETAAVANIQPQLRQFIPTNFTIPSQPFLPTTNAQPMPATKTSDKPKKQNNFDFPDGGWECSKCQNYNFKGRKNCHRCKKIKCDNDIEGKPEHMSMAPEKKAALKQANKNNRKMQRAKKQAEAAAEGQVADRSGDWVCQRCANHNYSFRSLCNKCSMTFEESQEMQRIYEDGARFLNAQLNLHL